MTSCDIISCHNYAVKKITHVCDEFHALGLIAHSKACGERERPLTSSTALLTILHCVVELTELSQAGEVGGALVLLNLVDGQ